jgi:AmpD protein
MSDRFGGLVDLELVSSDKRPRRGNDWVGIVIHHTGLGAEIPKDDWGWSKIFNNINEWLTTPDQNYASAHFHIGRSGDCAQLVDPDTHVAFHAGQSQFWHPIRRAYLTGWNEYAIGIELLGDGNKQGFSYSDPQYKKCASLCAHLMRRYPTISPLCVVGHEMVSPGRKDDPGRAFSWHYFYRLLYQSLEAPPILRPLP